MVVEAHTALAAENPPLSTNLESGAQQTLRHLHLLASHPGHWEIRALHRSDTPAMKPRGSSWFTTLPSPDGLIYQGLDESIAWAARLATESTEIFVGFFGQSCVRGSAHLALWIVGCEYT